MHRSFWTFPWKRLVGGFPLRSRGNASSIEGIRGVVRSCRRPGGVGTPCFRETRVVMPLRAALDRAEERLAGDELVDVAIRSPEVLPGGSRFAEQLDASTSQLVHCRGQVADGEADNRAGSEMLLARIAAAEDLGMPPIRQVEDPELCFLMHQPEAEDVLVEMRQFPGAICSRAAPSKTRDLHACQYHHHQGSARQYPRMRILLCMPMVQPEPIRL